MTIKPDDLRRCLRTYEHEVTTAADLLTQEMIEIELTRRQRTGEANHSYNTKIRQARETFEANLKDAGLA